jgi:hypothetical protein
LPGAEVRIDGEARGTLPLEAPLRVLASTVQLEVSAEGRVPFHREVEVPVAGSIEIAVELAPIPVEIHATEAIEIAPASNESWAWAETLAWPAIVLGGAGLAVATVLMILRENDARARTRCVDTGNPSCQSLYSEALAFEAASIATYVVSGTIAAAGITLLLLSMLNAHPSPSASACTPGALSLRCQF